MGSKNSKNNNNAPCALSWVAPFQQNFFCSSCKQIIVKEGHYGNINIFQCFACRAGPGDIQQCGCGNLLKVEQLKNAFKCMICRKAKSDMNAGICQKCNTFVCYDCMNRNHRTTFVTPQDQLNYEEIKVHHQIQTEKYCKLCPQNTNAELLWLPNSPLEFNCTQCKRHQKHVLGFQCSKCKKFICQHCSPYFGSGNCGCNKKYVITSGSQTCDQCGKDQANEQRWHCLDCNTTICFQCIPLPKENIIIDDKIPEIEHKEIDRARVIENPLGDEYLSQNLICQLCENVLWNPKQCNKCSHHYCKLCIAKNIQKNSTCPNCMQPFGDFKEPNNDILDDLMLLKFICSKGCGKILLHNEIAEHEKNCN